MTEQFKPGDRVQDMEGDTGTVIEAWPDQILVHGDASGPGAWTYDPSNLVKLADAQPRPAAITAIIEALQEAIAEENKSRAMHQLEHLRRELNA